MKMMTCKQWQTISCMFYGPEKDLCYSMVLQLPGVIGRCRDGNLTTESVQGASLALEGVDDIHGGDRLPLGVFGVGDGVTDHVLQENLENSAGLLVDEAGDTLDSSSACQTTDGGLGDALDVVAKNLAMTLGASFPQAFSSLASSGHCRCCLGEIVLATMFRHFL